MRRLLPWAVLLGVLLGTPLGAEAAALDGIIKVLAGREEGARLRLERCNYAIKSSEQSLREAEAALNLALESRDRVAEAIAREAVALSRDNRNNYRELCAGREADLQRAHKSLVIARRLQERSASSATVSSVVVEQRGRVEQSGASGEWRQVSADSANPLQSGDRLRTGPGSGAEFLLQDGATAAQLAANSEIQLSLDDVGNAAVDLTRGAFYAAVAPLFLRMKRLEVRTPGWAMAVRGTRFSVREDADGGTELLVLEGQVEVTPRGGVDSILVHAGYRLVLRGSGSHAVPMRIDWNDTRRWWREEVAE